MAKWTAGVGMRCSLGIRTAAWTVSHKTGVPHHFFLLCQFSWVNDINLCILACVCVVLPASSTMGFNDVALSLFASSRALFVCCLYQYLQRLGASNDLQAPR